MDQLCEMMVPEYLRNSLMSIQDTTSGQKQNHAHFYDGSFGLQHPLSDLLPHPLLPGQWGLAVLPFLLLALLLFRFQFSRKKT